MKKYSWISFILLNLLLLMGYINYSVIQKEKLLEQGQLILLELAPVDPRSLMQGDYMDLRYAITRNINDENISKRGFCIVNIDENKVARLVRIQENVEPLETNEFAIAYTDGRWNNLNIGAESFFFQEGKASNYEEAEYGGLKVDREGNSLLIGLFDENLKQIE